MTRARFARTAAWIAVGLSSVTPLRAADASPPPHAAVQRVLISGEKAADESLAKGCWVRLFDGIDYRGEQLLLIGPLRVPRMKESGEPWRDWDSTVIGPRAELTTFNAPQFQQSAARLGPDRQVRDLTRSTGRFDDIESVTVTCREP